MTSRRAVVAALVLICSCTATSIASAATGAVGPADHSLAGATGEPLEVTSVSPWVQPDGVFQVRFAPTSAVPLDSVFSYTVHQRLRNEGSDTIRSTLEGVIDGGSPRGVLQSRVSASVLTLGNPAEGLVLNVPLRTSKGAPDRVLVPTPGIHPVELRLDDATGRELWRSVVFLNRMPEAPVSGAGGVPARVSVTLALPIDGPPALGPDGRSALDSATTESLAAATTLLTEVPEAPTVLAVRPNVLSAVTRSSEPSDRRFLDALSAPGRVSTVARWPDVAVDTGGLIASDAGDELLRQVELGDRVLQGTIGSQPTTGTWLLDDTVSPESLPFIKSLGAKRLVVSPERLRLGPGVPAELSRTAAVGLQGVAGLTATAFDARLSFRLTAAQVDPALRANEVVTELMASWFTAAEQPATSFPGPSSVIIVPPTTDPEVLRSLVPALRSDGPLSTSAADVPTQPAIRNGKEVIAALTPRTPEDERGPAAVVRGSRRRIDAYRSMVPAAVSDVNTWELLNSETLAKDMDPAQRADIQAHIGVSLADRLSSIQLPRSRRVVLTSRDATIPLRFRNDLPDDVRLVMRTKSPRLEVVGGETREILLRPGENRIDLPVVVRAPGGTVLRIDVRSPDGNIRFPPATVPVTSSTISGLGAALSIISLLFLGGWWIRTARRRRRDATRRAGIHPSTDRDDEPTPPPDEPPPAAVGSDSRPAGEPTGSVGPGG